MEDNTKKSFGEFITQRRKALGMTQREFADKLFVTDSAVSKWERGVALPELLRGFFLWRQKETPQTPKRKTLLGAMVRRGIVFTTRFDI